MNLSIALFASSCGSDARSAGGVAGSAASAGAGSGASSGAADGGGESHLPEPTWPAPLAASTLPLEVLGPPGAGVEAALILDEADVDAAKLAGNAELVLTVHNVVEADSAQITINGGEPIDLGARGSPWLRAFDGQVASGKLRIDPELLVGGENSIVFRYTRQVMDRAAVSGFRVLTVGLELAGSVINLDLPAEDPAEWQPLDDSPEALERGRSYFQDISRDGGPVCARCHADSGIDLQYYAFSTHSIVERAMFHEFTRAEAEDLASYVRSLPEAPTGRPYDAPFQPGATNHVAAGAGYSAILATDASFAEATFGGAALPVELTWDFAADLDTFLLPTRAAAPTWMRWLPRELPGDWFIRKDGVLASAEQALAQSPTLEAAQTFMSAALTVGKDVLLVDGDYAGKVDVLRFAAVKLWDWSRQNGFDQPDHGVPDGSPAYPYEVGFAFFEAALADALPGAAQQTMDWWWAQLAANPGRGLSTGRRPLNFQDVLLATENAGLGPAHIAFLHLYGSWEESRGTLAERWGSADSPVRLLLVPMRTLSADDRFSVMRRFLVQEGQYLAEGGALDSEHHRALADAWSAGCQELASAQRAELRELAAAEVSSDLAACP